MSSILCAISAETGWEIINTRKCMMRISVFKEKLQEKIDARGWEPHRFAQEIDIPLPTVYKWLAGTSRPSPANAAKVGEFFKEEGLDWMRYAGYRVGNPKDPNEKEKETLAYIRGFDWIEEMIPLLARLSPKERRAVENLLRDLGPDPNEDTAQ